LAGRVLLKSVYLLVRRVLSLAVLISRKDLAKDAELLVPRHENAVLRRNACDAQKCCYAHGVAVAIRWPHPAPNGGSRCAITKLFRGSEHR